MRKRSRSTLDVRTRVEAAIALFRAEHGEQRLSVSRVCRDAGVNRANLYERYPDIVARIIGARPPKGEQRAKEKNDGLELMELRLQNKALMYLCLELMLVEQTAEFEPNENK